MKDKGITLVALVVTIIILLILAGVTLSGALSENGLFKRAKYAVEEYNKKSIEEDIQLFLAEKEMDGGGPITDDDIGELQDPLEKLGKKIIGVPDEATFNKIGQPDYPLDGIYVQTNDFELNNPTPIGKGTLDEQGNVTPNNPFTGIYYGNTHKITKLTIDAKEPCAGMFGYNEGTIKDVTIENCTVTSTTGNLGAIAGVNAGLIENCIVKKGTLEANENETKPYGYIGGICGASYGIVRNCKNCSNVIGTKFVGGIVGGGIGLTDGCGNEGTIEGWYEVGGIQGLAGNGKYEFEVTNCINKR